MGNSVCNCNNKQEQEEVGLRGIDSFAKEDNNNPDLVYLDELQENKVRGGSSDCRSRINNNIMLYIKFIILQRYFRNRLLNKRKVKEESVSGKQNFGFSDKNYEYFGDYQKGQKSGFGIQRWKDGAIYHGYFSNNKANHIGYFKHADGDVYKGDFKDDRACGYGLYKHANGASYEGMWSDDSQNGIGVEVWTDFSEYKGEYVKGKKHGIGYYKWADGSSYEGEWFENSLHGFVLPFLILGNL